MSSDVALLLESVKGERAQSRGFVRGLNCSQLLQAPSVEHRPSKRQPVVFKYLGTLG